MLFYRLILTLAAPVLAATAALRLLRGRERAGDIAERLGGGRGGAPGALWIHGASNGELTSARALIDALAAAFPDRPLIVTANTTSGRDLAARWALARLAARLAPVDARWATGRFLRRWRPAALIVLENELWPNRLALCAARGIPVVVVAARMSAQSAARWRRFGRIAGAMLAGVRWLVPQDRASADRFRALGLPEDRIGPVGSLKSGVALAPPPAADLARLRDVFARADTVLAASTHAGEDDRVIEAFLAARARRPDLRLILAPRHPRRSPEIAAAIRRAGLPLAVRSAGDRPDRDTAVYLADTLGDMALWYALAGVTFVGGSFVDAGGHTPFEPARAGSAILHGPGVANFAEAYRRLADRGGAVEVADAASLATALVDLADPAAQTALAGKATTALRDLGDAKTTIDGTIRILRRALADAG